MTCLALKIIGAPGWLDRERFDIQAIAPSMAAAPQGVLLQRLLEERFSLRLRRERREGDIYALVIARGDGRLGPSPRPFAGDCTPAPGGSVFTAIQEQLGLKLERRREAHDVLVIESVEMPTEN